LPTSELKAGGYRAARTPWFLLKKKKNFSGKARIGVIVGKTVSKSSARRNFWKRQARTALAAANGDTDDWLIVLSGNVAGLTKQKFREEVRKAARTL
jgi:ribonuclease P protein component